MAMGKSTTIASKTTAPPPIQRVSLNPDTFTSGGLLDDVDVVVKDAAFLMWDYNGQQAVAVPALGITFRILGEENDPDETKDHDQYYSCGKPEDWAPTTDGTGLVPIGAKTGLNNNTNAGLVVASLINVGVPKTLFDDGNIKNIVGLKVHVNRVPAPERSNATPRPDGRKPEILVATKLLALPGEGGTGAQPKAQGMSKVNGAAARPVAAKATAPAQQAQPASSAGDASSASGGEQDDTELVGVVLELVSEAGGSLAKKLIAPQVFQKYKGRGPEQSQAMKRAASDEFLMGLIEAGFTYDGATLTLA